MVIACGGATGCDNPGIYDATFAPYRSPCSSWVGPVTCTVTLADEGDFNDYQRVEGLDWRWGKTMTFDYADIPADPPAGADAYSRRYHLVEVRSETLDPVGTTYTVRKFTSMGEPSLIRDGEHLRFNDMLRGPDPERIACDPATCDAVTAAELADVVVELTADPAIPLRVVAVTPLD